MGGKKTLPYPKGLIVQTVRVLHRKTGEATDGAQNMILVTRILEKLISIKLKTWTSQTVSG